jgi:hypothetical protein
MITEFSTPQLDQMPSPQDESNETSPALRPWSTPYLQFLHTPDTTKSDYWAVELSTFTGPS